MKVIFEPKIRAHDPSLYVSDRKAETIDTWNGIDNSVIGQYEKNGYLIVNNAFNKQEIESAKNELSAMTRADNPECESIYFEGSVRDLITVNEEKEDGGKQEGSEKLAMGKIGNHLPDLPAEVRSAYVRKFMGFTPYHPHLNRLASHPGLINLIKTLCGKDEVELFQEMAMIKPPGGREKPWHQDHAYFNYPIDTNIVGVWIALGDVNEKNGCMFLLPGMHTKGPMLHFMKRDWQICDSDILSMLAGKRVCAPMKAGDVLIFDSKLPHGTPKNDTDDYRWAVQLHYKGTRIDPCPDEQRLELFGSEGKNVSC